MFADDLYGYASRDKGEGFDTSATSKTTAGMGTGHSAVGWNNQLFWLLVLILIVIGYLGFAFDVGLKKVGEVRVAGGSRA